MKYYWIFFALICIHNAYAETTTSTPELVDFSLQMDARKDQQQHAFFSAMPAGIRVPSAPYQNPLPEYIWRRKSNYELGYSDEFKITGLVISTRHYLADERADIAPYDMVVGWGPMSDPSVLKEINVRQNNRFYYWHVDEFPIPRKALELNSTNLHVVPDSAEIATALAAVKRGDIVELVGYLVDIKDADGFIWATSRVRDDSGDGACEILLVERLRIQSE